ncbi:MAG: GNAT family N-acetyltransferase [Oscillospiraceae bacterium]
MEQLSMKWRGDRPPVPDTAPGILITTYTEADREGLRAALLPLTGKPYTDEELDEVILNHFGVRPEGVFLAWMDGEIVGTTTGYFNPNGSGTIHMVSALEKAKGRGLGKILCQHAMTYLVENGCREIVLTTDDPRLPAIRTYLRLDFQPVVKDEAMEQRWKAVFEKLEKYRK